MFFFKTTRENKETAFLLRRLLCRASPHFCQISAAFCPHTTPEQRILFLFYSLIYLFCPSLPFPEKKILSFLRQKRPSFDLIHLDFFFSCTHGCQRRMMRKLFVSFLPIATHFSLFPICDHKKTSKRSSSLGFTLYIPQFLYPI